MRNRSQASLDFGGRMSRRFRWSLDLSERHQDGECLWIVLREMLAQDATDGFRDIVDRLPFHLCSNVRDKGGDIEFRVDTLDLFADDQAVLCEVEKYALISHVQEVPLDLLKKQRISSAGEVSNLASLECLSNSKIYHISLVGGISESRLLYS